MSYLSSESENESHLLNVIVSLQAQELQCDVNRTKNKNISEFQQIDAKINEQLTGENYLNQLIEVIGVENFFKVIIGAGIYTQILQLRYIL